MTSKKVILITPVAKGPLNLGDIQGYASGAIPPLAYGELIRYLKQASRIRFPSSHLEPTGAGFPREYG